MPFSWIYGKITDFRNALYDREVFKSHGLGAPAISVGNITVGGTGKTPLVAFIAGVLADEGEKVCVLTRGYGRDNPHQRVVVSDGENILAGVSAAGDEPFELAQKLLGKALVVADANRVAAAGFAREKFGVTAFVLDDAFQHRRAERELDVVLLDATNPFGNSKTLPFGRLREPLENLARADLVVVTRADLVGEKEITDCKSRISKLNPGCPVLTAGNEISAVTPLADFPGDSSELFRAGPKTGFELRQKKSLAFCALGNPENFFELLRRENFDLAETEAFPDHRRYSAADLENLEKKAASAGVEILLTTAKDAVKLKPPPFARPCFVVEIAPVFDDEKKLRELIRAVLSPKSEIPNPESS